MQPIIVVASEQIMKKSTHLTAVFERADEGGFIAYIAEIDGVNSQGDTIKEAQENLLDAFHLMMQCRKEDLEKQENIQTAPFMSLSTASHEAN